MTTNAKVAFGLSLAALAIVTLSSFYISPSKASTAYSAPVTIDPIPKGMTTPSISGQSAVATAERMTGAMMQHASSIETHLTTVGDLTSAGILVPSNFSGGKSDELWIVSIQGLNMPPAGPVGANGLPVHHQMNAVIDADTGAPVELYSDN